jgi:hypothetical protein
MEAGAGAAGLGASAGQSPDAAGGTSGAAGGGNAGSAGAGGSVPDATDGCGADTENDPSHCGYCGHDCLGGSCKGGECQPVELVPTDYGGWDISVGADAVFWTNQFNGKLFRLMKSSSSPQSWAGLLGPKELEVVGADVFVATPGNDAVMRAPADGLQAPSTYWAAPSGQALETLSADPSGVYFDAPNAIYRTDGQSATLVASGVKQPMLIETDASHVYFTTLEAGEVFRIPKTGATGPVTPIAQAGVRTRALALDSDWLYFATWDPANPVASNVHRIKNDGSGTLQALGGGNGTIQMVRAGPYLFWANQGTQPDFSDGTIVRARVDDPSTPGPAEIVASDQNRPRAIAADSVAVYWLNSGWPHPTPGSVWRQAL